MTLAVGFLRTMSHRIFRRNRENDREHVSRFPFAAFALWTSGV